MRADKLPQENNAMGLMRWFSSPSITDTVLSRLVFLEQEIPPGIRSGRPKFQGGQILYILQRRGHTLIDGVKHSWKADDLLNLALRKDGIIVEHVNDDPSRPAKFIAVEPNLWACTGIDRDRDSTRSANRPIAGASAGGPDRERLRKEPRARVESPLRADASNGACTLTR